MTLPSRSQTQQYRGLKFASSITSGDSALRILKDNGITQSLSQSHKTSTELKDCAKRIMHLNTEPQSSLKHGHPRYSAKEAFNFTQKDSGRLSGSYSAAAPCSSAIIKIDEEDQKIEGEIQQQTGAGLRSFGHRRGGGKSPSLKTVHFDSDLEYVRYFSKADKPRVISTSPSDVEKNSFLDEKKVNQQIALTSHWEIFTPNLPDNTSAQNLMPVKVQRLYFSGRRMTLFVFIMVANLAFEKSVVCRFTRDYWKTVSETSGQYYRTPSPKGERNCDKFVVGINLSDVDELDLSPLFLYVRYIVNDLECWDNNSGVNFEVDFKRVIG